MALAIIRFGPLEPHFLALLLVCIQEFVSDDEEDKPEVELEEVGSYRLMDYKLGITWNNVRKTMPLFYIQVI